MKMKKVFCALLCCAMLAGLAPTAFATERMTAAAATGPVSLNGCKVDNSTAQYPLLLYSNITYFPMTYHLCRFLGLAADWDADTRTLSISQTGERGPYVPDTGHSHKSGKVSGSRVDYPVEVNGVAVDNSVAVYPLFNYSGVTYFPLTFDFIHDAFGWTYTWDQENGLRIDSSTTKPAPPDTAASTGNQRLDAIAELLTDFYREGRTYAGTLTDKATGETKPFTAKTEVSESFDWLDVSLAVEPQDVFSSGIFNFAASYLHRDLTTLEPSLGTGGLPPGALPAQSPGGPYTGPYREPDAEKGERVYLAFCFLTCQFAGQRARMLRAGDAVFAAGDGTGTVTLPVDYSCEGFSSYQLTILYNSRYGSILSLSFDSGNYVLTMSIT